MASPRAGAWEAELAARDAGLRKARGVYETPPEIAHWLARAAFRLCREELGLAKMAVLDPAAGSGAMLVAALETGARVAGVEIMAGACRAAGARIAAAGGPLGAVRRGDALALDAASARTLLGRLGSPPALVVLGNPPYSVAREDREFRGPNTFLDQRVRAYHVPDRKIGVLRDLYVRFLALAEWLVCEVAGAGVVALVLNHSFLEGPAHRGLRARLAQSFDALWVLDLGGNVRRGQEGPMFDARIGTALLVGLRRPGAGPRRAQVWARGIEGTREGKLRWLLGNGFGEGSFRWERVRVGGPCPITIVSARSDTEPDTASRIGPDSGPERAPLFPPESAPSVSLESPPVAPESAPSPAHVESPAFEPTASGPWIARKHNPAWQRWPSLPELLPSFSEGVQTNRDALAVAFTRSELLAQVERFLRGAPGGRDGAHWTAAAARARLGAPRPELARPFLYRPFDTRWIYAHPALVHRLRPALAPLWHGAIPALVTVRQARGEPFAHVAAAWTAGDNCLLSLRPSSRAKLFPLAGDAGPAASALLGRACRAREMGAFALALMSAPGWQALAGEHDADWPRVPLPPHGALFQAGIALGETLLALWRTPPPPLEPGNAELAASPSDPLRVGGHPPLAAWRRARAGRGLHPAEIAAHFAAAEALERMSALRSELERLWTEVRAVTL